MDDADAREDADAGEVADAGDDGPTVGNKPVRLADEAELDRLVTDRDLVLVEFFTEGCGICASMEPVLGNVARATDATVALVNPRDDPPLVERFSIRSVPTFVLFAEGEQVGRISRGFVGTADLVAFVESGGSADGTADGEGETENATGGTPLDP